ncbi:NAD(P)-dependent oxidoreductase [Vibrio furnissii]|uniref:NAD(P)-dependent oxidoreductase n=1 Tax=Vibrio furnissii TaxID=29494 RepID=UPI0023DCA2F9|nr:NAD(P)-binding domain-containing protein [Vibrio furnissii]
MNTSALKIGFIGLGKMGSGICENIQKAGYSLTVYNRTVSKTEPFQQRGANVASSIKQLVEQSDIIFTSVLDDKSLNDVCQGEHGILESMTAGKIHVGLTTIQPTNHRGCAQNRA